MRNIAGHNLAKKLVLCCVPWLLPILGFERAVNALDKTLTISNAALAVSLNTTDATLSVQDRRTGRRYGNSAAVVKRSCHFGRRKC